MSDFIRFPNALKVEDLVTLLNSWPENTKGWNLDNILISLLDELGKQYGYGFLMQMAKWVADVQCYENPKEAVESKENRFAVLHWELSQNFNKIANKLLKREIPDE